MPSLSKPIRDQDKALVQKSGKIISESISKIGEKEVLTGRGSSHTNSGVCRPKEEIIPERKILKTEPDTNMKKNETSSMRNSFALLPHVLSNAREYQYVSKKAVKEPLLKYIISQKQLRALSSATSKASQLEKKEPLQLAMIGAAPFQYLARQKDMEVFAISMRNINYQLDKDKKPTIDPATRVPECYHNFLDIFLKDAFNTVSAYSKHDHVIRLLNEKNHGQAAMRPMSNEKLVFIKKFLEDNLKKSFIKASSVSCSSPIMLAVKTGVGIRFCIDY